MVGTAGIEQESNAFLALIQLFQLSKQVQSFEDLSDGTAFFDVLSFIDADYFRQPTRPSARPSDNVGLQILALQRLYRLVNQYFTDVLRRPTSALEVPDLHAIVKEGNVPETLRLCRLIITIAVQSEKRIEVVDKIRSLSEVDQSALMRALEVIMAKSTPTSPEAGSSESMTDDDHYYQIQLERGRLYTEKETLEKVYQALMEEHRNLQSTLDETTLQKDDALDQLQTLRRSVDDRRTEKADAFVRVEVDRLQTLLQKSEDALGTMENELESQTLLANELKKKVEDLQPKADEAVRLKDQLDEYRHAVDKLQKTENVMVKYKKKLEESADLRRTVKALEEQNASLVDKNASLEQENQKVSALKPLMESYKSQIVDLEAKHSARQKDHEAVKFELEQVKNKLKVTMDERAKDSEALELYQERVRELELSSAPRPSRVRRESTSDLLSPTLSTLDDRSAEESALTLLGDEVMDSDAGLGGELHDALSGRTMTDLKLQVRQLQRELDASKNSQADSSRVLVLESLLEDANRMKTRYESDYLAAHREKLIMQSEMEEIRSGKSLGDGTEAAIALRQRLNETVDQLDTLQKRNAELEVENESLTKAVTIARSDLNLVNKDQLDILASLRESVNEDKSGLEAELQIHQNQIRDLKEKTKMQLEQINSLLMEKVTLQGESIGQREKLLARERDMGDLKAVISGKDVPEETKARLLGMHEENVQLKEQVKTINDKLAKARQFIKSQDKLFKDEMKAQEQAISVASLEEVENTFKSQMKILEEEVIRYKRLMSESDQRYRQEQQLMLSAIHDISMNTVRGHMSVQQQPRTSPSSWLGKQRKAIGRGLVNPA